MAAPWDADHRVPPPSTCGSTCCHRSIRRLRSGASWRRERARSPGTAPHRWSSCARCPIQRRPTCGSVGRGGSGPPSTRPRATSARTRIDRRPSRTHHRTTCCPHVSRCPLAIGGPLAPDRNPRAHTRRSAGARLARLDLGIRDRAAGGHGYHATRASKRCRRRAGSLGCRPRRRPSGARGGVTSRTRVARQDVARAAARVDQRNVEVGVDLAAESVDVGVDQV